MTERAPNLSDIHPPSARITPEGSVNMDAIKPALANDIVYTLT
ncbi:MAG: hypothetical protein QF756_09480 [Dehalococcoidia bacterium]|nr:hypothetical protein [Dehalococcoidia bacterium]